MRQSQGGRGFFPIRPDFSIRPIEILNCTFDPKWLYQRYIQVEARAIQKTVVGCPVLVKGSFEEAPSLSVFSSRSALQSTAA